MSCMDEMKRTSFKKRLGQHMLVDEYYARRIVESVSKCRVVYEIGCGLGGLTLPLSEVAEYVFCSEVDGTLISRLKRCIGRADNVDIIHADATSLELSRSSHVVVSNTPFYLSSKIIVTLCRDASLVFAILGVQREVAERMLARAGSREYGRLSVVAQLCFNIEKLFIIPRSAYVPRPKVDTAVVKLTPRGVLSNEELEAVEKFTRAVFPYRRKKLSTGLSLGFHTGRETAEKMLLEMGLDPKKRVEEVTPEEVLKIVRELGFNS